MKKRYYGLVGFFSGKPVFWEGWWWTRREGTYWFQYYTQRVRTGVELRIVKRKEPEWLPEESPQSSEDWENYYRSTFLQSR